MPGPHLPNRMAVDEGVADGEAPASLTPEEHAWLQEQLQNATLLEVEDEYEDWQDPSGGLLGEIFGACQGGDAQDLGVLLGQLKDTQFSINTPGPDGDTPLHIACLYGTTACVQQLLDHGCDPTAVNPEDGTTVLHDAAAGGYLEIVELLVDKTGAALLDVQDEDGDTPLHNAARGGHARVVRYLLAEGAGEGAQGGGGGCHGLEDQQQSGCSSACAARRRRGGVLGRGWQQAGLQQWVCSRDGARRGGVLGRGWQ